MGVLGHGPSLGLAFVVGLCISLYVVRADLTSRREEACSRSFRTVWVNGSHWEAGRAIGEALRTEIKDFLATPYARKLVDFCSSSNGTRSCARWVSSANSSFPWTITELEATAAGAGVGVADLFAVNLADEIHLLTGDFPHVASACSTLLNASGGFIAHNEDGGGCLSPVGDVAMVVSTGVASLPVQTNAPFAALVYPGMLPGYAFGVNGNGVGLTVNSEFVKAVDLDGVPNSFVARALLAAPTAEHAAAILADTKLASGFTANLGSVSYPTTLVTVEAAALYGAARRLTQPWTAAVSELCSGDSSHQLALTSQPRYSRVRHHGPVAMCISTSIASSLRQNMRTIPLRTGWPPLSACCDGLGQPAHTCWVTCQTVAGPFIATALPLMIVRLWQLLPSTSNAASCASSR